MKRRSLLTIIFIYFFSNFTHAAIPVGGWGYSLGNALWGIAPWHDDGAGWWDPPADQAILKGRITLKFDPNFYQIKSYGWFGDFGANPNIAAPKVIKDVSKPNSDWASTWILQDANPNMQQNVQIDNAIGLMVVNFDWGDNGYKPKNNDHFNFFGYTYSVPKGMTNQQLQNNTHGAYGEGKMSIIGNAADVVKNGVNASTYMLCSGGYCGETPIPGAIWLFVSALSMLTMMRHRRKTSNA